MMLMNLFSIFDPSSFLGFSLNWLILIILFLYLISSYFKLSSIWLLFLKYFLNMINNIFKEVAVDKFIGIINLSLLMFVYLILCNLMGLFPFIFTCTAHIFVTLGFGFVLWLSFFFMGWVKNFKSSAAHLVPEGSPLFLSPIMVMIESISHLMRPFTLSIRLAANMMAGHLIIGLLSKISILNMFSFFISLFLQSLLMILELAVAIIQSFVFSILLLLYSLEYY